MIRSILTSILLLAACLAGAADWRIEVTLTFTNLPVTSNTFTLNSESKVWTNDVPASTNHILLTNTIGGCLTNFVQNVEQHPFSNNVEIAYASTNSCILYGAVNASMSAALSGTWGYMTYTTNTVWRSSAVLMPLPTNYVASFATNQMAALASNLTYYSDYPLPTGSLLLSNYATLYTSQTLGNKLMTNAVLDSPTITNGVNYGAAFRSPGSGSASEQFGSSASATGDSSLAVGVLSKAQGYRSIALGDAALAVSTDDLAIGYSSGARQGAGICIGVNADVDATNSIALGTEAIVATGHTNSIVIGNNVTSTAPWQITLGNASHTVLIPGDLDVTSTSTLASVDIAAGAITNVDLAADNATVTNLIAYGGAITNVDVAADNATVTNLVAYGGALSSMGASSLTLTNSTSRIVHTFADALAVTPYALTTLSGGNNAAVAIATNTLCEITSGPGAAFTVCGIDSTGVTSGQMVWLINLTGYNMTIAHQSGVDPTPANRIITMTGADRATTGNGIAQLYYSASQSRWILIALDP